MIAMFAALFLSSSSFAIDACAPAPRWPREMIRATEIKNDGAGMKIAVIDSGIDPRNPAFRDLAIVGKDFAGGNEGAPVPFFDNEGHGSHVAGIIAGVDCEGSPIGLAPRATLYVARACGERGCRSDDVGAAVEWAIEQKVDVINMSIEGDATTTSPRETEAVRRAIANGIAVVTISGNGGDLGSTNSTAEIEGVIVAGAINKWREKPFFSQNSMQTLAAPGVNILSAAPRGHGEIITLDALHGDRAVSLDVVHLLNTPLPPPEGLRARAVFSGFGGENDFTDAPIAGRIAIVEQGGGVGIEEKITNAESRGAKAVVLVLARVYFATGLETLLATKVPVMIVAQDDREFLIAQSRRGGELILTGRSNDYVLESGTSMAAPFVTGAVALIRSVNHELSPVQVKALLARSAAKTELNPSPIADRPFGAGVLDVAKALEFAR